MFKNQIILLIHRYTNSILNYHKTFLSLILFITIFVSSAYAQQIKVLDKSFSIPLAGVIISDKSKTITTITNSEGVADIRSLLNESVIYIQLLGYTPIKVSIIDLSKSDFVVYLESNSINLAAVAITANRLQIAQRTSEKLSLITAEDIQLIQPQTSADMIGSNGDVFVQKSQQGGGSPMIRGFATNRLIIAVDGVRMNTAIFRSGNIQNIISIDPNSIEKAEVLFGPSSVLYGSDAIGGVMHFYTINSNFSITKKPIFSASVSSRYSSANMEINGNLQFSIGLKKWKFNTAISKVDFDDLRMGSKGREEYLRPIFAERAGNMDVVRESSNALLQNPSGYEQFNLMHKVTFAPSTVLEFNYGVYHANTGKTDRYDRLIRLNSNGIPRSAEWFYGPQIWTMNQFSVLHKPLTSNLYTSATFRLAHQFFEESRNDRNFNSNILRNRLEQVNAFSVNADFFKSFQQTNRLFYGLEAIYNDVYSKGTDINISTNNKMAGPARYPLSNWQSYAIFAAFQTDITSKITLQSGLRYNLYKLNAQFDNTFFPLPFSSAKLNNAALTANIGLVYNPADTWAVNSNISTGFRAPNVDDIGKIFDSTPGSVIIPNPALKAEYAYNIDIGITKLVKSTIRFEVNAFYTYLDDAFVRRDFTLNGMDSINYSGVLSKVQALQNAANAQVFGFQLEVDAKLNENLNFTTNLSYQKGVEVLDNGSSSPLRHAAPLFGQSAIQFKSNKITMMLSARYSSSVSFNQLAMEEIDKPEIYAKDKNGNPFSPTWYTLNFKSVLDINSLIKINIGLENIFDTRYRSYSSGLVAPGRNLQIAVKLSF